MPARISSPIRPKRSASIPRSSRPSSQRAEREVREGLLPSAQIAVARHGQIAAMRTFGRVTHEGHEAAATNDTLYVVFSATKAITSAAAWLLIEEGKLVLDARVADFIPEFGTNGKDVVTVEQLFTHTSRLPVRAVPAARVGRSRRAAARFGAGGSTGSRARASSITRRPACG